MQTFMQRRVGTLLAAVVLLSASSAWACGTCTDLGLLRMSWWMHLPLALAAMLLVDALATALFGLATHGKRLASVLRMVAGAAGILLGVALLGIVLTSTALTLILVAQLIRDRRHRRDAPEWQAKRVRARGALAFAILSTLTFILRPAARPTDKLIDDLLYPLPTARASEPSWMETELRSRPKAVLDVERRLRDSLSGTETGRRDRQLAMLHASLGGSAQHREALCRHWRAKREGESGSGRQEEDAMFAKACGASGQP